MSSNVFSEQQTDAVIFEAFEAIDDQRIDQFLVEFSNFHTRRGDSYYGKLLQLFLSTKIVESLGIRMEEPRPATVTEFGPVDTPQKSVIVKLPGEKKVKSRVIIMAHQDSISGDSKEERSPAWDDNGSGTAALLEAIKVICQSGIRFYKPVEFLFTRSEELGLKGSNELAKNYKEKKIVLDSVLNIDSVGYLPDVNSKKFGVVRDMSTDNLATALMAIITKYTEFTSENKVCGYSCGDSFPFKQQGFATVMLESLEENDTHHTPNDIKTPHSEVMINNAVKVILAFICNRAKIVSVDGRDSGDSSDSDSSDDD